MEVNMGQQLVNGEPRSSDRRRSSEKNDRSSRLKDNEANFFMKKCSEEEITTTDSDASSISIGSDRGPDSESEMDFGRIFSNDSVAMNNRFKCGVAEDKNTFNRRQMEDYHLVVETLDSVNGDGLFALFDGHSGKSTAEHCKNMILEEFSKVRHANPMKPVPLILSEVFKNMEKSVAKNRKNSSGCTTGVAILVSECKPDFFNSSAPELTNEKLTRMLYTANVGDTRIVLCRRGVALRLSRDHTCHDLNEIERIRLSGGVIFNFRVNGTLAVTRAIGNISAKSIISEQPYTSEVRLTSMDQFFIIACDGLWDVCTDQHAVNIACRIPCPEKAAQTLVKHAIKKGSTDNLTVMVVRLDTSLCIPR